MSLTPCIRCNQRRNPADLYRGLCLACRPHRCRRHRPGSPNCYRDHHCRCPRCLDAGRAYNKRQEVGANRRVPAAIAVRHIDRLRAAGMTDLSIGLAAGVAQTTIGRIRTGQTTTLWRRTAAALLRVQPGGDPAGTVDALPTTRRLQALATLGWSSRALAAELGITAGALRRLRRGDQPYAAAATAAAVRDAYDRLAARCPRPSTQVLRTAAEQHWPPPMAWDDGHGPHGIDNPRATPVGIRREAA